MNRFLFLFFGLLLFPITVLAQSFSDTPENYKFYKEIEFIKEHGLVSGYSSLNSVLYKPEEKISRAEFIKIIISALYGKELADTYNSRNCFSDIPVKSWFTGYVCLAKEKGIINGYADKTFKPNDSISLPEAMKIILEGFDISIDSYGLINNPEIGEGKLNGWYAPYLDYYSQNFHSSEKVGGGLLSSDFLFGKNFTSSIIEYEITRGEMAYFIKQTFLRSSILFSAGTIESIKKESQCFSDTGCLDGGQEILEFTFSGVKIFSLLSDYTLHDNIPVYSHDLSYLYQFKKGDIVFIQTYGSEMTGTIHISSMIKK